MVYVTLQDVKEFMGFSNKDMKINGVQMSEAQFEDFVNMWEPKIAQMIHRYCNVTTFYPTLVTEYKNGRGASDDDTPTSDYLDSDVTFYLRNLYLTDDPVTTPVVYAPISVYEDITPTGTPTWTLRSARSSLTYGDYKVISDAELTSIRFHANVPIKGNQNVKFTYYTGYAPASAVFGELRLTVLRAFKNLIMLKKKTQEASTIRNYAVRDYSQMFEPFDESSVLSESEKAVLDRYKRYPLDGEMFY
jgi:hypothetical protein